MRVLIGCEESGVVRRAFKKRGHDAFSCDLLPARDGGEHLQMDIMVALRRHGQFDLVILYPDCTKLSLSGNRHYGIGKPRHQERLDAIKWTFDLWNLAKTRALRVCLENPTSVLWKANGWQPQWIHPWQFGHGETKKTGLLLHNLPPLKPTNVVEGREHRIWKMGPSPTRNRDRSETYIGIANAMADQWGNHSSLMEQSHD